MNAGLFFTDKLYCIFLGVAESTGGAGGQVIEAVGFYEFLGASADDAIKMSGASERRVVSKKPTRKCRQETNTENIGKKPTRKM